MEEFVRCDKQFQIVLCAVIFSGTFVVPIFLKIDLCRIEVLEPAAGSRPDMKQEVVILEWSSLRAAACDGSEDRHDFFDEFLSVRRKL